MGRPLPPHMRRPQVAQRRWYHLGAVLGAIILIAGGWWIISRRQESLDQGAQNVIKALLDRDAGLLLRYADDAEVEGVGLTEAKLAQLLKEVWGPRIGDAQPVGHEKKFRVEGQGALLVTRTWRRSDGSEVLVGVLLVQTERGPKLDSVSNTVVLSSIVAMLDGRKGYPSGAKKLRFFAESLRQLAPDMRRIGFDAIGVPDANLVPKPMPLDEYARSMLDKAAKLEMQQ